MAPDTRRRRPNNASRLGFIDAERTIRFLDELGLTKDGGEYVDDAAREVVTALAATGDPDEAVLSVLRLSETAEGAALIPAMRDNAGFTARLGAVLGASRALGDWLIANGDQWRLLLEIPDQDRLIEDIARCVGADLADPYTGSGGTLASTTGTEAVSLLRLAYKRCLLEVAARDLVGEASVEEVADRLSVMADALVQTALSVAAAELAERAEGVRLSVIAMGKCGAHELNYLSDVDVIFVGEPIGSFSETDALRNAAHWASEMMRICGDVAWEVDAALRPEGKSGALVRTMDGHRSYYQRWARTWEFQALLKARPMAGDAALGAQYTDEIAAQCWTAVERDGFVEDVQAMRRRVEENLNDNIASRELKLGPGGLRDIEFSVQLLQMVHGRTDSAIRPAATLEAIQALSDRGYIGRTDASSLSDSYRFLRILEHRLMLQRLRRTHLLPDTAEDLRPIARTLGYGVSGSGDEAKALLKDRANHAREVRRLHEKVFYRPLLTAVAALPGEAMRLTTEAAVDRLRALGFERPDGVLKHVEVLTAGTSRTAAMQRILLPTMLAMFADSADPDAGILAYRQVSEQLGHTPWYLRLLRDEGAVAERLAHLLGSSRYIASLFGRAPEAIQMLAEVSHLQPRMVAALEIKMRGAAQRATTSDDAISAIRSLRRGELVRIAAADLLGYADIDQVGNALCALNDATVRAGLFVAMREVAGDLGISVDEYPCVVSVIGMGRYGGQELSYGSDADVIYVYDTVEGADPVHAAKIANRTVELMGRMLGKPGPDPALGLDADLRPEGKQGALVRSLSGYAEYYARWSQIWEAQALLRARPVAGDDVLGARFLQLIDPIRYPTGGIDDAQLREIRRIKARVDNERLPRGADPTTHLKLGRGGLADIEWTVQLLQLQHAAVHHGLWTTGTLSALDAAVQAELIDPDDADALEESWRLVSQCRDANMLIKGKASDQLPHHARDLVAVARILGYPTDVGAGQFLDDYHRVTRHARAVAEKLFYET
ncbi:glutamate-ammonia-ligase adenylyltransferase [Antricoccus suffuscus]|uniref:Glutamate-ammonia-ligase adenylyltransferase n=1 Tax=Antricoccus suffuscus TaxID=1629062 RepID=A0A2T0ZYA0_9ACTN|nr:bifunctional [glutamine synthetase] adenylyltransferase/[glutamine synthetase]-adenylyl-L-tyrosine phosphorylase [Antricoccus suffuscus]PRZ41320.1 glutamate-ammonia-ligase adenylyltransferase [Antricoccus suffuscus]